MLLWDNPPRYGHAGGDPEGGARMKNTETRQEMSRRGFLELGLAGISAAALLFLSGCGGEEDDDEGDDDD